MVNRKNEAHTSTHTDSGFVDGFRQYFAFDCIVQSQSWEEAFAKVEEVIPGDEFRQLLFDRFKAMNFVVLLEHSLCSFFRYCDQNGLFKKSDKAKEMVLQQVKRFKRLSDLQEAESILSEETKNDDNRIWTPHILMFVAGYSLGTFLDLIRGQVSSFTGKDELVDLLTQLNIKRNLIFHNSTSSHIDINQILADFMSDAKRCEEILDAFVSES